MRTVINHVTEEPRRLSLPPVDERLSALAADRRRFEGLVAVRPRRPEAESGVIFGFAAPDIGDSSVLPRVTRAKRASKRLRPPVRSRASTSLASSTLSSTSASDRRRAARVSSRSVLDRRFSARAALPRLSVRRRFDGVVATSSSSASFALRRRWIGDRDLCAPRDVGEPAAPDEVVRDRSVCLPFGVDDEWRPPKRRLDGDSSPRMAPIVWRCASKPRWSRKGAAFASSEVAELLLRFRFVARSPRPGEAAHHRLPDGDAPPLSNAVLLLPLVVRFSKCLPGECADQRAP
mmetsp:Transcript_3599/g.13113  ORF Transcript_3599/g.13113 Transcript_3599/m.13113 type:complete len:291 (+) Transcript_3599:401-1273(+)